MASVRDVILSSARIFGDSRGQLASYEVGENFIRDVARVFVVKAGPRVVRGHHAHRRLVQTLVCVHGRCNVECSDGTDSKTFLLDDMTQVLTIPPSIWSEQTYLGNENVLMVICDQAFDEADYIRDYNEFLDFRKRLPA